MNEFNDICQQSKFYNKSMKLIKNKKKINMQIKPTMPIASDESLF